MEAETLLEGYVEKIHNLRPLKDKLNFFKYGFCMRINSQAITQNN